MADDKVVGSVSMGQQASQPITEITLNGETLVLRYSFDYQGRLIDAAISLTPGGDKVGLQIDFAGGAIRCRVQRKRKNDGNVVRPSRFELLTFCFGGKRSI